MRPALDDGDDGGKDQGGQRSDIGNEAQQASGQADEKAEIQPDQGQADAIPQSEEQADQRLSAQKSG